MVHAPVYTEEIQLDMKRKAPEAPEAAEAPDGMTTACLSTTHCPCKNVSRENALRGERDEAVALVAKLREELSMKLPRKRDVLADAVQKNPAHAVHPPIQVNQFPRDVTQAEMKKFTHQLVIDLRRKMDVDRGLVPGKTGAVTKPVVSDSSDVESARMTWLDVKNFAVTVLTDTRRKVNEEAAYKWGYDQVKEYNRQLTETYKAEAAAKAVAMAAAREIANARLDLD